MKHSKKQTKSAGKARKAPKTRTPVAPAPSSARTPRVRDPRLPPAGTVLVRPYKGKEHRLKVLEDWFEYEGEKFRSLTAAAKRATGYPSISGTMWWNVVQRPTATPTQESAEKASAAGAKKARAPKAKRAGRDPQPETQGATATDAAPAVDAAPGTARD